MNMDEDIQAKAEAVYYCELCNKLFKNPGMCPSCDIILKKQAG